VAIREEREKQKKLKKEDKILDLACGHGRHAIELKKRNFNVDGLDLSDYLLSISKKNAEQKKLTDKIYKQDIHNINT